MPCFGQTLFQIVRYGVAGCVGSGEPQVRLQGRKPPRKTEAQKFGAKVLQKDSPLEPLNVYPVGFHPNEESAGPSDGSTSLLQTGTVQVSGRSIAVEQDTLGKSSSSTSSRSGSLKLYRKGRDITGIRITEIHPLRPGGSA